MDVRWYIPGTVALLLSTGWSGREGVARNISNNKCRWSDIYRLCGQRQRTCIITEERGELEQAENYSMKSFNVTRGIEFQLYYFNWSMPKLDKL